MDIIVISKLMPYRHTLWPKEAEDTIYYNGKKSQTTTRDNPTLPTYYSKWLRDLQ